MAEFTDPMVGVKDRGALTEQELIRAIRFMVAAEYEAIQMYEQIAEGTSNELAKKVITSVVNEERIHVGEFLRLLKELCPDEEEFYDDGAEEVEKEIKKQKD